MREAIEYKAQHVPYPLSLTIQVLRPGAQDHSSYKRHLSHAHAHMQTQRDRFEVADAGTQTYQTPATCLVGAVG